MAFQEDLARCTNQALATFQRHFRNTADPTQCVMLACDCQRSFCAIRPTPNHIPDHACSFLAPPCTSGARRFPHLITQTGRRRSYVRRETPHAASLHWRSLSGFQALRCQARAPRAACERCERCAKRVPRLLGDGLIQHRLAVASGAARRSGRQVVSSELRPGTLRVHQADQDGDDVAIQFLGPEGRLFFFFLFLLLCFVCCGRKARVSAFKETWQLKGERGSMEKHIPVAWWGSSARCHVIKQNTRHINTNLVLRLCIGRASCCQLVELNSCQGNAAVRPERPKSPW